jgi:hypothetical protein
MGPVVFVMTKGELATVAYGIFAVIACCLVVAVCAHLFLLLLGL